VHTFTEKDIGEALFHVKDVAALLGSGQVSLLAQSQFDRERREVGAELFVCWTHPMLGAIPAMQFIAAAEDVGVMRELGGWILERACLTLAKLSRSGVKLRLSVNVSLSQLRDPDFVVLVREILDRTRAPGRQLVLEISEKGAVPEEELDEVTIRLERLVGNGVQIGLDNFGPGFANLSLLKRYPLSEMKLHPSLAVSVSKGSEGRSIAQAMVEVAHSLRLRTVGTGIERQPQVNALLEAGCDLLQGYHLARPIGLGDWLSARI
jgi:diguanylate cyclase